MKTAAGFAASALAIWATASFAQTPATPQVTAYSGTIGPYRVGLELTVQPDHKTILAGHYFYATRLTDIPLRVGSGAGRVDLVEPAGGAFHLHFVANGSEHGAPLDFYNSVGLAGTWVQGATTLPVTLQSEFVGDVPAPDHRYALIGDASDAVVEHKARQFLQGVTTGSRDEAAAAVSYPLTVNLAGGKSLRIRDRGAFLARWNAIATPAYVAELKTAVPHDMFVNYRGAMVAGGAAWFNSKGASALNVF